MKFTEQDLLREYRKMDLDTAGILQRNTYQQICAKRNSFKRKAIWGLSAASVAAVAAGIFILLQPAEAPYLVAPDELNQMNFAFYRDLACPGQDLGISFDDFPSQPPY